jgi:Zn-dependent protease
MFGWAKPVPVAFGRLNNPKPDMIRVALAGPAANIVMGIGWAFVLKLLLMTGLAGTGIGGPLVAMSEIGILINALLAAFNIIPIPPLDGGRVLRGLVSESAGQYLDRMEPFGLIIIVVLLASGLLWTVVGPLLKLVQQLIVFVVGL